MQTNEPQIRSFVERIERLNDEKAEVQEAIKRSLPKPRPMGMTPKRSAR